MVWLITGLLLALSGGLVMLARRARRRPMADETLIADLLGQPAGEAPRGQPAGQAQPGGQAPPAPSGQKDAQPPPVPAARPASEGDWLEDQLALITAWSERMQEQVTSWAADADPPSGKPEPAAAARPADTSQRAGPEPREPAESRPLPHRCSATTAKGSRCKLPARPGDTTCAIHARR
jgi:hypothetical protein